MSGRQMARATIAFLGCGFALGLCGRFVRAEESARVGQPTGGQSDPTSSEAAIRLEKVTVDLSRDLGPVTYRASGFLHGMTATDPPQELVAPLKPKLFRNQAEGPAGTFATYSRVKALGARSQLVVSDSYWGRKWPQSEDEWRRWDAIVEGLVRKAQGPGYQIEWDIWNEPSDDYFWEVDQASFFETWRRTFLKIRELDPKAVIVGPSLSDYDSKYLEEFLVFAKDHHVLPDILSWHELSDAGAKDVPAHFADARWLLAKYDIGITLLCINEIIAYELRTKPGSAVQFFAALEREQADGACHATWPEAEDRGNPRSLSGTLTREDKRPRATWWAYKAYADITGRLVSVEPSATVDGVAGCDRAAEEARVALGRRATESGSVTIRFAHLDKAPYLARHGRTHVTAERIPVSEWEALPRPVPVLDRDYPVQDHTVEVELADFGPDAAYAIRLHAPE
jgi:xylan 1,4-beta-xylosidase